MESLAWLSRSLLLKVCSMATRSIEPWTPTPDPTVLTTEALLREIGILKELLQSQISSANNIYNEKFINLNIRFSELERLRMQTAQTNNDAIAAALLAQKESTSKTEASFTKQIDQLQVLINAISRATDEKIDDVKTRLDLNEGKSKGFGEGWGFLVGVIGIATGILVAASHYIR